MAKTYEYEKAANAVKYKRYAQAIAYYQDGTDHDRELLRKHFPKMIWEPPQSTRENWGRDNDIIRNLIQ